MAEAETPFVLVGSTEGVVRAYSMSEVDGSLRLVGSHELDGLGFFAVGSHPGQPLSSRTVFVSSPGAITAVTFDAKAGSFVEGPRAVTSGGGTHVAVDSSCRSVFLAHYSQNSLSHFSFSPDSGFGEERLHSPGKNAHQVRERAGVVYVPCLGSDHVAQFYIDAGEGAGSELRSLDPEMTSAAGGPRHMDFHPTAPVAYVLTELRSEIRVYDVGAAGELLLRTGASVFTHDDEKYHWSSDIKVRPDGRFVYAVNRAPQEIVTFEVGSDHGLSRGRSLPLTGEVRSFGMDPKGAFLQVGGKDGVLQTFNIDDATGELSAGPSLSGLGEIHHTEIIYIAAT